MSKYLQGSEVHKYYILMVIVEILLSLVFFIGRNVVALFVPKSEEATTIYDWVNKSKNLSEVILLL